MNIEWIDKDFKDMVFNPWNIPNNVDLLEYWPDLGNCVEFQQNLKSLSKNKAIRYIAYMYDKYSPLQKKIDNIYKQKMEAARLAGFKLNATKTFPAYVDIMMAGFDHKVNHMIIRYLRLMRDDEFMQFRIYKEKLYNSLQKMQEIDDPKMLNQIIAVNKALTNVIENIKLDFVQTNDSKRLIQVMYEQAEFEDLELTPEIVADRINKGLDPVVVKPYGNDYEVSKLSCGDGKGECKNIESVCRGG